MSDANIARPVGAAVAQSFGAANASNSSSLVASTGTATAGGDLLVAAVRTRGSATIVRVTTIMDSAGNTWTKAASVTEGTRSDGEIWYSAGARGVLNVTAQVVAQASLSMTVLDLTGTESPTLDVVASAAGSGKAATTGNTNPTSQASEIAVAVIGWSGTTTASQQTVGFTTTPSFQSTAHNNASGEQAAYTVLTSESAQAYAAHLSSSVSWTGLMATFKTGPPPPPPVVGGFSPTSGPDGTAVTVTGTYLTGATAVAFNGVNQPAFNVDSDTQISTTVPIGATSGPISVTTPGGGATSAGSFTVEADITGLSPGSGAECTSVSVSGSGFAGASAVAFNGTPAPLLSSSTDAQIQTAVPVGATSGPISVTTSSGTASSSESFTVVNPATPSASISPSSGAAGTQVVITGTGFTGATAVSFNCTNQPSFTVNSDTQITSTVPSGMTSGGILITTPVGIVESSTPFAITPGISEFGPASGPVGTEIAVYGSGLNDAVSVNIGGASATITEDTNTELRAIVDAGATTGDVTVTTPGGTATTSGLSPSVFSLTATPSPAHVLLIMEENKGYAQTIGACTAIPPPDPYLCSLVSADASDTAWYGVSHPSAPNYVAIDSGSTQGITSDCVPNKCGPFNVTSFGGQLTAAGIPWVDYQESMPSACFTGAQSGEYVEKHNGFLYFADVRTTSNCAQVVQPYPGATAVVTALDAAGAPDFVWITPNLLDDMHSGSVAQGDAWLQANLPGILGSAWFAANGTVIITMDENSVQRSPAGGLVPMVIISAEAQGIGAISAGGNHYGTLRTLEDAYGLPYLGGAANLANGDLGSLIG